MLLLLEMQLAEYKRKYERLLTLCAIFEEDKKDWKEYAKEAAGYKIMIEATEEEIARWD